MHIRPNSIPLGGTTVVANINCNSEGVLEKALTFKNRVHHPIDFIENEYETENDDVVIHIKKEVSSTGSRIAGEPLRRKLKKYIWYDGIKDRDEL